MTSRGRTVETGGFRAGERHDIAPRTADHQNRLVTWVIVRVTGLLLTVLVLGHFSLTHIFTDVADTGTAFVDRRWGSAFWLTWDWLMLAAAVSHGAAGIWIVIADYTVPGLRRRRLQRLLLIVSVLAFVIGSVTIAAVILD
jgi:succinate dehydrogenase / fumarate reductase membrane anchor subunit